MLEVWTRNLNPEDKERFKNAYAGSKTVLDRQVEILDQMESDVNDLEINPKAYDIPNWSHRQADLNGYRRALKQVKNLIK
jgi:hypothetical protein